MSISLCADIRQLPVCITYQNSLQSTMWTGTLIHIHFTLLAYAPEPICLPHHLHAPVHYYGSLHKDPQLPHMTQNNTLQLLFTMLFLYMCQQQICTLNAIYTNYFLCRYDTNCVKICFSYELTTNKKVTRKTSTHTLHMISICPKWNIAPYD